MSADKFYKKKSLGQHFLTSPVVPRWMADAADLTKGEVVLEIGPGTGVLTHELLARGAKVVAIETDVRALTVLKDTFANYLLTGQLRLIEADARQLNMSSLELEDQQFKVVANIPYYLSGHLFRTILESPVQPTTVVFLVQKEVAARIARSVKESLLSLSVKAFGEPRYVKTVGRGHFVPPPAVDSAIIAITNISHQHFQSFSSAVFFDLLHLGFGQKRKQLLGNLSHHYQRDKLIHIFSTLSLLLDVRAEDVPLEKWLSLANLLLCPDNTQAIDI